MLMQAANLQELAPGSITSARKRKKKDRTVVAFDSAILRGTLYRASDIVPDCVKLREAVLFEYAFPWQAIVRFCLGPMPITHNYLISFYGANLNCLQGQDWHLRTKLHKWQNRKTEEGPGQDLGVCSPPQAGICQTSQILDAGE